MSEEPDDVGSVSDEAVKLLGALSDWAREANGHVATGSAECTYCPICRTVHALRQTSPEVREHLAVAATSLLQAAAGLLATAVPPDARAGEPGGARGTGVERIDLDDDTDDDLDDDTDGAWPEEDDR
ncbi:MAG: hypothetical protein JWO76_2683 [Nocardioides sp.]|nr:hypothetical protein [Nocardioides sp.]